MSKFYTTGQFAKKVDLPKKEVVRRIRVGDIEASKLDWIWIIPENQVAVVQNSDWYKKLQAA